MANFWPGSAPHFRPQTSAGPLSPQTPQQLVQPRPQFASQIGTYQGQSPLGQGQAQGFGQQQGFGQPQGTGHVAASEQVGGLAQPQAFGQGLPFGQTAYGQVQQGCVPGHLTGHAVQAQQTEPIAPGNQWAGQLLMVKPLGVAQQFNPRQMLSVQSGTVLTYPGANTPVQNAPMLGNMGPVFQLQPGAMLPNPGQALPVQGVNLFPNVYPNHLSQAQTPFSFPVAGPRPVTPPNSQLVAGFGKPSPSLPGSNSFPWSAPRPGPSQGGVGGNFVEQSNRSPNTAKRPWQQRWRGMGKKCEEPGCNFFGGRKTPDPGSRENVESNGEGGFFFKWRWKLVRPLMSCISQRYA